jgi:hypothetical protein
MAISRAVGEDVKVPRLATPEIDTAGPVRSFGAARRLLRAHCPRRSFSQEDDSARVQVAASAWSVLRSAVPRVVAFNPPTPRALGLSTS